MPYLNQNGVRLYYEVHGPSTGTPLILSHGYAATSQMWHGQIVPLTKAGYRLIIWDMRGHGKTDYPSDQSAYSEAHTLADINAILDKVCGPETPAIVGGFSLGGYMSLAFYRIHPERVKALLIIDTGPGFKKDAARDVWNKDAQGTAAGFERNGLLPLKNGSPERSIATHRDATGLGRAARGMLAQRNSAVIESLPNIQVPSLVVVGSDDKPFLAASDYMAKKIPGAKKAVIPRAGHAANLYQPEAFNEAVLSFLRHLNKGKNARL